MLYRKSLVSGTLVSLLLTTNLFAGNCVGGVCYISLDNLKPHVNSEKKVHLEHLALNVVNQRNLVNRSEFVNTTVEDLEPITLRASSYIIDESSEADSNQAQELTVEPITAYSDEVIPTEDQNLRVMIEEDSMSNQILQQSDNYCEEAGHLVYNIDTNLYECV